jgi:hypothetical protein
VVATVCAACIKYCVNASQSLIKKTVQLYLGGSGSSLIAGGREAFPGWDGIQSQPTTLGNLKSRVDSDSLLQADFRGRAQTDQHSNNQAFLSFHKKALHDFRGV